MVQRQGSKKDGRKTSEAGKVRSGGTPSKPPRTRTGSTRTAKRFPWRAQVFANVLAVVCLYLLLVWQFYRASCVPPYVSAAGITLLLWSFAQLIWRFMGEVFDDTKVTIPASGISLSPAKLRKALHPWWLKNKVLVPVCLFLIISAAWILGPFSPFRRQEILPIVQGFEIKQGGKQIVQFSLGEPASIGPEVAHIRALVVPSDASCKWGKKKGLDQAGCTASYLPPQSIKSDVITVEITTPCGTLSRSARLNLNIQRSTDR